MDPITIIDRAYHGDWDTVFPDPVELRKFREFLDENVALGTRGFAIRFIFHDENVSWASYVLYHFDIDNPEIVTAQGLMVPTDPQYFMTVPDEPEFDGCDIYDYTWPKGLTDV